MKFRIPLLHRPTRAHDHCDVPPVVLVEGDVHDALLLLAGGYGAVMAAMAQPGRQEQAEEVRAASTALASAAAAVLTGGPAAEAMDALQGATEAHRALLARVFGERVFRTMPRSLRHVRESHLAPAASALREQALENHDSELLLGEQRGVGMVALTGPVTAAQAHAWLLGAVYERVEGWIEDSGVPALEREASRWYFERWRSARVQRGDEFARVVREQEFSLVEREIVTLGTSAVEHVVAGGLLGDAGRKQRRVAAALPHSRCGVWEVMERSGEWTELRHPLGRHRFRVAEHAPEHPYGAGDVMLGRLIPLDDDTWLRSPGAAIIPGMPYGFAQSLAEGIEEGSEEMPFQVVLEAALHTAFGVRGLPREVRPRVNPDDAAEILRTLHEGLEAAGAAERLEAHDAPPEFASVPGTHVYRFTVDCVLNDYMGALCPISQKSRGYRETLRRRKHEAKERGRG
jgi:hypothetical protein